MQSEFPKSTTSYLKPADFHDNPRTLTFKGYEDKANEDLKKDGKVIAKWEDRLKYCVQYSFPEMAFNKTTGQPMKDKDGNPFKNRNWNPKFPQGYYRVFFFEEGQLSCSAQSLFDGFARAGIKAGDKVTLVRTGKEVKEMKWTVKRASSGNSEKSFDELPEIQLDDLGEATPF